MLDEASTLLPTRSTPLGGRLEDDTPPPAHPRSRQEPPVPAQPPPPDCELPTRSLLPDDTLENETSYWMYLSYLATRRRPFAPPQPTLRHLVSPPPLTALPHPTPIPSRPKYIRDRITGDLRLSVWHVPIPVGSTRVFPSLCRPLPLHPCPVANSVSRQYARPDPFPASNATSHIPPPSAGVPGTCVRGPPQPSIRIARSEPETGGQMASTSHTDGLKSALRSVARLAMSGAAGFDYDR